MAKIQWVRIDTYSDVGEDEDSFVERLTQALANGGIEYSLDDGDVIEEIEA